MCMVIEATQWLTTPLPCAGQLGTWRLSDDVRRCIASPFATDGLAMWNWAIRFPNEPGALERARKRKREARGTWRPELGACVICERMRVSIRPSAS